LVAAMLRILLLALFLSPLLHAEERTDEIFPRLDSAIQKEFYQTLEVIDSLFRENKITYWITAGSLLGAIRHGEMIPWDDDIDLALFIDDLGKVIRLRSELEKKGLVLLVKRDYLKIFPVGGKRIAHPDGGFYPHRYPFVDLFLMTRDDGRVVHASERLREGFEQDWLEEENVALPFPQRPFGSLIVPVPRCASTYLERMYGEDCWEYAYVDYDHASEQKRERIIVKIH